MEVEIKGGSTKEERNGQKQRREKEGGERQMGKEIEGRYIYSYNKQTISTPCKRQQPPYTTNTEEEEDGCQASDKC